MKYIVTFYAHFGAIRFKKLCEQMNIKAKIMPVPRDLSSSCGTCVLCEGELIAIPYEFLASFSHLHVFQSPAHTVLKYLFVFDGP